MLLLLPSQVWRAPLDVIVEEVEEFEQRRIFSSSSNTLSSTVNQCFGDLTVLTNFVTVLVPSQDFGVKKKIVKTQGVN